MFLMVEHNAVVQFVNQNSPPLFHVALVLLLCRIRCPLLIPMVLVNTLQSISMHVPLNIGEGHLVKSLKHKYGLTIRGDNFGPKPN